MDRPAHVLPVIVGAQFAGTSLWFAGNAVLPELQVAWGLDEGAIGSLTSSVQLGFIAGTLVFAVANVADRLPARAVFLACALLGAAANAAVVVAPGLATMLALRFAVGFFLAGIYPVGMKIAASWFEAGLGRALGLLVGALVLGTAFPHGLRAGGLDLDWRAVLLGVSGLAAIGGVGLFATIGDGPHLPKSAPFDARAIPRIFSDRSFRAAALGYFGHMWELYAFWAFVPVLVASLAERASTDVDVSLWSCAIIAAGAVGCGGGGLIAERWGSGRVAAVQVGSSAALCLLAPALVLIPFELALVVLLIWGVVVAGDSPQFSVLNARHAPRDRVGTALTMATCIGFFLTIPSLQMMGVLIEHVEPWHAMVALAPGPIFGLLALRPVIE